MKKLVLLLGLLFIYIGNVQAQTNPQKEIKKSDNVIEMVSYYDNGQIKVIGTFDKQGKLNGHWTKYNEAGDVVVQGTFTDGMKTGKWLFWDKSYLNEVTFIDNKVTNYVKWSKEDYIVNNSF